MINEVEIATLNLYTGEIDLYNTEHVTLGQLADFVDTVSHMRDNAYLMTNEAIEEVCAGGFMRFTLLTKDHNKEQGKQHG